MLKNLKKKIELKTKKFEIFQEFDIKRRESELMNASAATHQAKKNSIVKQKTTRAKVKLNKYLLTKYILVEGIKNFT